jgi:hypothetical protein
LANSLYTTTGEAGKFVRQRSQQAPTVEYSAAWHGVVSHDHVAVGLTQQVHQRGGVVGDPYDFNARLCECLLKPDQDERTIVCDHGSGTHDLHVISA